MAGRRVAVFLLRPDEEALRLAGSCALTAAAMGDRVDAFVFGAAIAALLEGADEEQGPAAALLEARRAGGGRLLACSAGLVERGLDPAAAERLFDAVVGWPTVVEWTRGVADRFFF